MVNTFLVIFLNQNVGSILNPIYKISLSILSTTFWTTKQKKKNSTKKVKGIKINLNFIFNNLSLRLVYIYIYIYEKNSNINSHTLIFLKSWSSNSYPHRGVGLFWREGLPLGRIPKWPYKLILIQL